MLSFTDRRNLAQAPPVFFCLQYFHVRKSNGWDYSKFSFVLLQTQPVVNAKNAKYLHHMLMYACPSKLPDVLAKETFFDCGPKHPNYVMTHCPSVIAAWAMGSKVSSWRHYHVYSIFHEPWCKLRCNWNQSKLIHSTRYNELNVHLLSANGILSGGCWFALHRRNVWHADGPSNSL